MASGFFSLPQFILSVLLGCLAATTLPGDAYSQTKEAQFSVPYLTLRNRTQEYSSHRFYGQDRSDLKAGWCNVKSRSLGIPSAVTEAAPFYIPEEILSVDSVDEMEFGILLDGFEKSASGKAPLLYTHGFYMDFDKGCRRATVLRENTGLQDRFLWFSWPSDGDLLNYTHDESDLYWSVPVLANSIAGLEHRFGPGQVNLAGHSLGGRGMALALNDIAGRFPDVRLGEVVLIAPDMDFEIFRLILPRIRPIVNGITIYVAGSDRPLALSATLHGHARLGETGNDFGSLEGVEVIDVSKLPVRSPTGHLYHIYNDEVGDDMNQLLNGGIRAEERRNLVRTGENIWSLRE